MTGVTKPVMSSEAQVIKDLQLTEVVDITQIDPELEAKADKFLEAVLNPNTDTTLRSTSIDQMGSGVAKRLSTKSEMLKQPINELIKHGEDGGPVANTLLSLKNKVDELNPNHYDLTNPGTFMSRMAAKLPFVGNKVQKYFDKYRSGEAVISQIIDSLDEGSRKLKNDSSILSQDKQSMLKDMAELRETIKMGLVLKQKLEYKLQREFNDDEEKKRFVEDELMFPLVQRIGDLQQKLVVTMQGIAAMELIIRNNRELVRGIERAKDTTIHALQIAVTVALSLGNQKLVLDCINQLNATTNQLIMDTAKNLRMQGGEIQKQAVSSTLDVNALQQAWDDTVGAINDYDEFRRTALPQMKENMEKMGKLSEIGAKVIEKMEKGDSSKADLLANMSQKTLN